MNDVIRLLPESVASRIAAGEVVQRPASVVKELVENAVDAGATNIRIMLTDAGRTSIQVVDDGCGMSENDAVTAFERHATSKISTSDDLYALHTFGFRGEALASIAAVAEVRLRTRMAGDEVGTQVDVRGGKLTAKEPVSCQVGSSFTVNNLFYNLPARRRFLKSNQTELSNIIKEVERVSLAHPELSFSVYHQDGELLTLPASNLKQRIVGLFGSAMNKMLLPVLTETSVVTVSGFVGSLEGVRKKGAEQFFFVNGRYMRHPYFHKAVLEPYESLVPQGDQPSYFIFLTVPADTIDVNIHPTKTEIKFSEEQLVWKILNAAVREAVGRYEGTPSIDFDTEGMPDIPVADSDPASVAQPKVNFNPSYNPFDHVGPKSVNANNWSKLYEDLPGGRVKENTAVHYGAPEGGDLMEGLFADKCFFQFKGSYIVLSSDAGIMVIDQRRAHIAILYDRYMRQVQLGGNASQGLLFPEMVQLSVSDAALLPDYEDDLKALGFDLSDMGHGAVAIQGVPSGIEDTDYTSLLVELLHSAAGEGSSTSARSRERMALSIARSAAINRGRLLSDAEISDLLERYEACGMPTKTPDGKTISFCIGDDELKERL